MQPETKNMSEDKKAISINSKIVSVALAKPPEAPVTVPEPIVVREQLTEKILRPEVLQGRTYKIKPPEHILSHALYLTINDIVLNEGTIDQSQQPFEIFLTSKDTASHQWIQALTLAISAIFRKGGDVLFIVNELKSVSDPNGSYFHYLAHGRMPSLVAHIGYMIEEHFKWLGLIKPDPVETEVKAMLEEVKETFVAAGGSMDQATVCPKCHAKAVIRMDNCPTCTNCGDSKCG